MRVSSFLDVLLFIFFLEKCVLTIERRKITVKPEKSSQGPGEVLILDVQ